MIAIGLMSGTSLDGIDAALVRLTPSGERYALDLLGFTIVPFETSLLERLRDVLGPQPASLAALAALHRDLGLAFAHAGRAVAGALQVDFVAMHGQTIFHDGAHHLTTQIGDPFVVREALGATVCFDFRSADCAVGGHGAPLVPYVDAMLFASADEDRVALNVGGIANLTALPRGCSPFDVLAFDSGPGNILLDTFVRERTAGAEVMDEDGAYANAGCVDAALLESMLAEDYFAAAPPKSTGRELFGEGFLARHRAHLDELSLEDGCATLAALTARTLADGVRSVGLERARLLVGGGGAHNLAIMQGLQARLPHAAIETTDAMGIPSDAREAIAFAILGYETLRERAANVPRVTGASRAVPLGAIAPYALARVLAEVANECR